jgi:glutamate racemase
MQNDSPIGFFDSGIGGVTIWKAVHKLLPFENSIYLADSINAPYGQKTKQQIIDLCFKNVEFLLKQNAKIIVVACNTATTNAVNEMRAYFDIPVIGIEPAIKPAATQSKTHKIGILATKGTLNSELFSKSVALYKDVQIIEQIGHGLVELIEAGKANSTEMSSLLQSYLQPMLEQNIDFLVLGCSHYPFLISQIQKILPAHVAIIDSGEAVAKQTFQVLKNQKILSASKTLGQHTFYTNTNPEVLKSVLEHKYLVIKEDF